MDYFRKICEKHIGVKVNKLSIDEFNSFVYIWSRKWNKRKETIDGFIIRIKVFGFI